MANIQDDLNRILSARYGKDVRQSIHDAIRDINDVAEGYEEVVKEYRDETEGFKNRAEQIASSVNESVEIAKGYSEVATASATASAQKAGEALKSAELAKNSEDNVTQIAQAIASDKEEIEQAKTDTLQAKSDAENAKTDAESASQSAKSDAESIATAKDDVTKIKDDAVVIKGEIESLKSATETASQSASESATASAESAEEAKEYAQQASRGVTKDAIETALGYTPASEDDIPDISGKVDKEEGKSLIADNEITRLASVDNYDDTEIKEEITELKKSVSNGKTLVANAITEKGVATESTATFATMADNISQIETGGKSNPNILDNGWFNVNSRGQSEYKLENTYSFDRWITGYGKFKVEENGISINIDDDKPYGTHYIYQLITTSEMKKYEGKTYTISAYINGELITRTIEIPKNPTDRLYLGIETSDGYGQIVLDYFPNVQFAFYIHNLYENNDTPPINIKAVKLEEGTESTLHLDTAPDYGRELLKCINSHADPNDTYANKYIGNPKTGNWLDNGYFLVNQRGKSEYTGNKLSYDRWNNMLDTTILSQNSGIKLSISGTNNYWVMNQLLNPFVVDLLKGKAITVSIKYKNCSGAPLRIGYGTANVHFTTHNIPVGNGIDSMTQVVPEDSTLIRLILGRNTLNESSIEIEAIKLEIGDHSTLAEDINVDIQDELRVCEYYLRDLTNKYGQYEIIAKGTANGSYYTDVAFNVGDMYKTPTVDATNSNAYSDFCFEYYSNNSRVQCNAVPTVQNYSNGILTVRFSHPSISTSYIRLLENYTANAKLLVSADI